MIKKYGHFPSRLDELKVKDWNIWFLDRMGSVISKCVFTESGKIYFKERPIYLCDNTTHNRWKLIPK